MTVSQNNKNGWKKFAQIFRLILLIFIAVCFFSIGTILLIYSIVSAIAFKSAMVYLILAGSCALSIGIGLFCVEGFLKYHKNSQTKCKTTDAKSQQVTSTCPQNKPVTHYFTISNVSFCILAIGTIFSIVSALLGVTDSDKWLSARKNYMQSNGYYVTASPFELTSSIEGTQNTASINSIEINLIDKIAFVKYEENDSNFIRISGYMSYERQVTAPTGTDGVLRVTQGTKPQLDGALEKMLFFLFEDNKVEEQILICIPSSYKDTLTISGNYILTR